MLGRSINENINIASFGAISTGGFIHDRKERARADDMITLFNVKTGCGSAGREPQRR